MVTNPKALFQPLTLYHKGSGDSSIKYLNTHCENTRQPQFSHFHILPMGSFRLVPTSPCSQHVSRGCISKKKKHVFKLGFHTR